MPRDKNELDTPWVRERLILWLARLDDASWRQEGQVTLEGFGELSEEFDQLLDFFDDSGLLANPQGAVGYVLFDEGEVAAMRLLGVACDAILDLPASSLADIMKTDQWRSFGIAAELARKALEC